PIPEVAPVINAVLFIKNLILLCKLYFVLIYLEIIINTIKSYNEFLVFKKSIKQEKTTLLRVVSLSIGY
ncbi:MAG: hypothetical protein ACKVIG_15165, partial [Flavobacteriales bacterium]